MKLVQAFIYIVVLMCLCGALHSKPLVIKGVSHSPLYLEPVSDSTVEIKFRVNSPCTVTLKLFDDRDLLIKTITHQAKPGDQVLLWDVTDNNGNSVPPEAYKYTLTASDNNETVVYDTSDITGNILIKVEDVIWNKKTKTISFTLQKSSRVSLNSGILDGGPLLGTILDWAPRQRGKHAVAWNGMDPTGSAYVGSIEDLAIVSQAFTLSDNTIIIGPDSSNSSYISDMSWGLKKRQKQVRAQPKIYNYSAKTADKRQTYKINLNLPKRMKKMKKNLPVYKNTVPVRIDISAGEVVRIKQDRFEPMLFIDGKFVSELETGFFPLTWQLDTKKYDNGKHYVTVNIRGYDGQYGTATRFIYIEN